jgi:hypothetical protein
MPYTTRITLSANRQINSWGLAEPIWMEVLLHLYQTLAANPQAVLLSLPNFPSSMLYYFTVQDPEHADLLHEFMFQVTYHADEQHLDVLRGSYWRHIGGIPDN